MSMFYELMMRKKEQIMYATIKGSLTENDGVFSGFAYNNYLATQEIFDYSKDFEIVLKINTGTIEGQNQLIRNNYGSNMGSFGFVISIESKKIRSYIKDSEGNNISNGAYGTTTFSNNNDYFLKLSQKLNNGTYAIKIESSTNGTIWTTENNWTSSYPIKNSGQGFALGGGTTTTTTAYWRGSIDLNRSYIKLGSTKYNLQAVVGYRIVGSPTIVDGVVSGFSSSNRIYIANTITADANFEYNIKFKTNTFSAVQWLFGQSLTSNLWCGVYISTNVKMAIPITSIDGSNKFASLDYALQDNTIYRLNVKRIGDIVTSTIYDNIGNVIENKNYTIVGNVLFTKNNFGGNPSNYGGNFLGEIYMNETYIKINNKLWFNGQQA